MTNPVAMVRNVTHHKDGKKAWKWVMTWCPGCDELHPFTVEVYDGSDKPRWDWDGNLESPTFNPSMLSYGKKRCHSFLRNGVWEFLSDSEHDKAGQKVPMVPLPDWLVKEVEE